MNEIPKRHSANKADLPWLCVELPRIGYAEALDFQHRIVAARCHSVIGTDVILMLEHPPVFTVGRRGGQENLVVPGSLLKKSGISLIRAERGGNITYHGPGQLVVYPIIDLREAKLTVADYVTRLEEVMVRTAADWKIKVQQNSKNRGVWVGENKLGSIGIAIRHGVSFHGFALNVNLSLKPFAWIHPCGLQGIGMTSIKRELSRKVSMEEVRASLKCHIREVFKVEVVTKSLSAFRELMNIPA